MGATHVGTNSECAARPKLYNTSTHGWGGQMHPEILYTAVPVGHVRSLLDTPSISLQGCMLHPENKCSHVP